MPHPHSKFVQTLRSCTVSAESFQRHFPSICSQFYSSQHEYIDTTIKFVSSVLLLSNKTSIQKFYALYLLLLLTRSRDISLLTSIGRKGEFLSYIFKAAQYNSPKEISPIKRADRFFSAHARYIEAIISVNFTRLCLEALVYWNEISGEEKAHSSLEIFESYHNYLRLRSKMPTSYYFIEKDYDHSIDLATWNFSHSLPGNQIIKQEDGGDEPIIASTVLLKNKNDNEMNNDEDKERNDDRDNSNTASFSSPLYETELTKSIDFERGERINSVSPLTHKKSSILPTYNYLQKASLSKETNSPVLLQTETEPFATSISQLQDTYISNHQKEEKNELQEQTLSFQGKESCHISPIILEEASPKPEIIKDLDLIDCSESPITMIYQRINIALYNTLSINPGNKQERSRISERNTRGNTSKDHPIKRLFEDYSPENFRKSCTNESVNSETPKINSEFKPRTAKKLYSSTISTGAEIPSSPLKKEKRKESPYKNLQIEEQISEKREFLSPRSFSKTQAFKTFFTSDIRGRDIPFGSSKARIGDFLTSSPQSPYKPKPTDFMKELLHCNHRISKARLTWPHPQNKI